MIKKESNISWSKTKDNIEDIVKKYNFFVLSVSHSQEKPNELLELKLLDAHEIKNEYVKLTDDELNERVDFINYVRFAYNKLTTDERKIVYWTYFDKENKYDDRFIANNLGFSLGYYYIKKKDALIRFAYSLAVEVVDD